MWILLGGQRVSKTAEMPSLSQRRHVLRLHALAWQATAVNDLLFDPCRTQTLEFLLDFDVVFVE